jgi:hypothetical protein
MAAYVSRDESKSVMTRFWCISTWLKNVSVLTREALPNGKPIGRQPHHRARQTLEAHRVRFVAWLRGERERKQSRHFSPESLRGSIKN